MCRRNVNGIKFNKMSKNSAIQTYYAAVEWNESRKRAKKSKRKNTKNATTPTKPRYKPNNRRNV